MPRATSVWTRGRYSNPIAPCSRTSGIEGVILGTRPDRSEVGWRNRWSGADGHAITRSPCHGPGAAERPRQRFRERFTEEPHGRRLEPAARPHDVNVRAPLRVAREHALELARLRKRTDERDGQEPDAEPCEHHPTHERELVGV